MNRHWRLARGVAGNAVTWGVAWGATGLALVTLVNVFSRLRILAPLRIQLILTASFALNGALVSLAFSGFVARRYRGRLLTDLPLRTFTVAAAAVSALLMPVTAVAVRFALLGHLSLSLKGTLSCVVIGAVFGAAAGSVTLRSAQRLARRDESQLPAPDDGTSLIR